MNLASVPPQPELPRSRLLDHAKDSVTSPSVLLFAACAIALAALTLLGDRGRKPKIARGKFAGEKERRHARRKAISQLESPKPDAVALWIREPSQAEFVRGKFAGEKERRHARRK
ncbi:MAG: hypothetical protein AAFX40_13525, partial [Cyanobacteria bacterium J06639_1]